MEEWRYNAIILDLGIRWRWMDSFTPLPLYSWGNRPWSPLDRRPVWTLWGRENSRPCRESNPGRPARRQSLYRLSYPGSLASSVMISLIIEDLYFLGYNAEWSGESQAMFRRNISSASSRPKSKTSTKPACSRQPSCCLTEQSKTSLL
jgi:hypothetical protein